MSLLNFEPQFYIKNKHLQTILSSKKNPVTGSMVRNEIAVTLTVKTDETVNLTGLFSPQPNQTAKGLIILLHGWLGCAQSTYMLGRGEQLYQQGYELFRLNLRDHGPTLGLNKGLFHGARLEEVFQAVKQITTNYSGLPTTLIGFSMGGSFALRIGWRDSFESQKIPNLNRIIAVCPSVNPEQVTRAIDNSNLYRRYFIARWKKNLLEKQRCFPELYDFSSILLQKNSWQMTEKLLVNYSEFKDIDAYFTEYHFSPEKLKAVRVPMTILTAEDDPVIPIRGFNELKNINPLLELHITRHGGHVGYINNFRGDSWLDTILPKLI
ncbi:TPA: YheT family hydrolase [Legionella feeleii]